jgi:hypothetical protein
MRLAGEPAGLRRLLNQALGVPYILLLVALLAGYYALIAGLVLWAVRPIVERIWHLTYWPLEIGIIIGVVLSLRTAKQSIQRILGERRLPAIGQDVRHNRAPMGPAGPFSREFKKYYYGLRDNGWDPAKAFDSALAKAAKEVGYSGWPLPQDWIDQATQIAIVRDGDALEESRRGWDEIWQTAHEGRCYWCEMDSSEEPFAEGVTFNEGGLARQVHRSCLEKMREHGLLRES